MLDYLPELLKGLHTSLTLTAASIVVALILSLIFTIILTLKTPGLVWVVRGYITLFTGTPLLVQIFLIYYGPGQFPSLQEYPLLAGGSGLSGALAANAGGHPVASPHRFPSPARAVVFSGSCSTMSNRQVNRYKAQAASCLLDVARCLSDTESYSDELSTWAMAHINDPLAPLLYATQPPEALQRIQ
ncbi:MAG: ABC transporter permease subunit, partial [Enterobacter sp.]|nr:ABC transporter permease subunit [Enterobacter sp.]